MANIKSINGNPIVPSDGSVGTTQMSSGGMNALRYNRNGLVPSAKLSEIVFEPVNSSSGGIYVKIPGTWWFRGMASYPDSITYSSITLTKSTSPRGVTDCLFIAHNKSLVYDNSASALAIVDTTSINNANSEKYVPIFNVTSYPSHEANAANKDGVFGGIGKWLYDEYMDLYSDNNALLLVSSATSEPYFEPTTDSMYVKLDGTWNFRGTAYETKTYSTIKTEVGSSYVKTSPSGVTDCLYIPSGYSLYLSKSTKKVMVENYNLASYYGDLPIMLLGLDVGRDRAAISGGIGKHLYDEWANDITYRDCAYQLSWAIKSINSTTGLDQETTYAFADKRIASDYVLVGKGTEVHLDSSTLDYYIFEYDLSKVVTGTSSSWQAGINPKYVSNADRYIRILVRNHDDSTITDAQTVAQHVHMLYVEPSDITLSKLEDSAVPSYYDTQMSAAIDSIRENMAACGQDGDTFVFVTDLHWDPYVKYDNRNARRSPDLVRKVVKATGITKIITGGDYFTGNDDADFMADQLRDIFNSFAIEGTRLYTMMGNHDWNKYNTPTGSWNDAAAYSMIMKPIENHVIMGDYLCYHFDVQACKTRYIVLNSGDQGDTISQGQMDWLAEVLDSTPSGYRIIVGMHIWYDVTGQGTPEHSVAVSTQGTQVMTVCDAFNAADTDGREVVLLFGGHCHDDHEFTTSGGIPIVLTDCDAYRSTYNSASANTITEQCVDVVTIDYSNGLVKCVRIGRGDNRTVSMAGE